MSASVAPRVAVVGAGMAGLTAAWRLQQGGADVTLFESEANVGGRAATVADGDCLIDTGAILMSPKYERTLRLLGEMGLAGALLDTRPVMGMARDGVVHELDLARPLRSMLGWGALSAKAKWALLRVLPDLMRYWRYCGFRSMAPLAGLDEEDCRSYALRVLGAELHDRFVDPLIRVNMFSSTDCAPVADLIWLLRMFAGTRVLQLRRGMNRLPQALAQRLHLRLSCPVTRVEPESHGVVLRRNDGGAERFDAAVLAVPPPVALRLAPWLSGPRRAFFEHATAIASVAVTVRLSQAPKGRAAIVMVPTIEQPDLLAVVMHHNKAADRTPAGTGLVTLHLSQRWAKQWALLDDQSLAIQALRDARGVLGDLTPWLTHSHVQRWLYVDYRRRIGSYRLLRATQVAPNEPRTAFAGEYISAGIEAAVISGEAAAAQILSAAKARC